MTDRGVRWLGIVYGNVEQSFESFLQSNEVVYDMVGIECLNR